MQIYLWGKVYAVRFLYGPRFPGLGATCSMIVTTSSKVNTRSMSPARRSGRCHWRRGGL